VRILLLDPRVEGQDWEAEFHLKIVEAAGNRVLMRLMINLEEVTDLNSTIRTQGQESSPFQ